MDTLLNVLVLLGGFSGLFIALERLRSQFPGVRSHEWTEEVARQVRELAELVDRLPSKWEEMRDQTLRAEQRSRALVTRARKELAELGLEHAGLDAESAQLRLVDGEGSESGELQPVRRSLAAGELPSAQPPEDWREMTRRKKYGG